MNDPTPSQHPAGWYPDPSQPQTQRYWDGSAWTEQRAPLAAPKTGGTGAAPIRLIGALLGATAAVIGVFLPRAETDTFAGIAENTLIQNGDGVIVLVLAVAAALTAYGTRSSSGRSVALILLGLAIVGFAIFAGTGDRLELTSVGPLGDGSTSQGTPGVGLWVVGIGGALIALAGLREGDEEPSP